MIALFQQLKTKKIIVIVITVLVLVGLSFYLLPTLQALAQGNVSPGERSDISDESLKWLATMLTWVVVWFINLAGNLLTIFIDQLIGVATYNDFIDSRAVAIGWVVVRDIANIFFVVIMLLIAFGTLFKIQTYEYKKLLPKLVIAVILVNFSKMIVGVAIDFGQVIMLTFVRAFEGLAAGAIVNGLGLNTMLELRDAIGAAGGEITYWNIFGAAVLALIMLIIAGVTILSLIVVLLFRIIMLWILIIFAPFAFLASVLPTSPLQKVGFFGQYWSYLSKYIIVGPILAFFLWLSFSILMQLNSGAEQHIIALHRSRLDGAATGAGSRGAQTDTQYVQYLASEMSSPQNMFDYMVTIALLIGSLMVTQQMGVLGGAMGMNAVNKMKGFVTKTASRGAAGLWRVPKAGLTATGRKMDKGSIRLQEKAKIKAPMSLRPSIIKSAWDAGRERKEDKFYKGKGIIGGMEDRFNSLMSRGKDKTQEKEIQRGSWKEGEKKRIAMAGTADTVLKGRLDKLTTQDENGKLHAIKGQEPEVQAVLELMMANHDSNEIFKDEKLGKAYKYIDSSGKEHAGADTPENLEKLTKDLFGHMDPEEAARVHHSLQFIGFQNNDTQHMGRSYMDRDGKYKFIDINDQADNKGGEMDRALMAELAKEGRITEGKKYSELSGQDKMIARNVKQAKMAAGFQAKKPGRSGVQAMVPQNYWHETADGLQFDELNDSGREFLKQHGITDKVVSGYEHLKPEMQKAFENGVGSIRKFAEETPDLDEETKNKVNRLVATIIKGKTQASESVTDEEIADWQEKRTTGGGEINHEQEITKKTKTIEENEEKVTKLRKEEEDAGTRKKNIADAGAADSYNYIQAEEEEIAKKKQADDLVKENDQIKQEIRTKHQPETAKTAVDKLDEYSFKNPAKVEEAGQKLAEAIDKVTAKLGDEGEVDFSKSTEEIDAFVSKLNKLNKEMKNLKPGYKAPDLSFAARENMQKIEEPEAQKGILEQLKFIARNLANKAKPEAGSAERKTT